MSRRLLALSEGEIAALTTAMRQLGVGSQGGEALAIFRQPINDESASGSLATPLARIKVDEKTVLEWVEWNAVQTVPGHLLPRHAAAAGWKAPNLVPR